MTDPDAPTHVDNFDALVTAFREAAASGPRPDRILISWETRTAIIRAIQRGDRIRAMRRRRKRRGW